MNSLIQEIFLTLEMLTLSDDGKGLK